MSVKIVKHPHKWKHVYFCGICAGLTQDCEFRDCNAKKEASAKGVVKIIEHDNYI